MRKFLFPTNYKSSSTSLLLLVLRVAFGVLLITHGIPKIVNFEQLSLSFPDPLDIGSQFSLILAIFAEVLCSILLIFGFLTRLAVLPLIKTMSVICFIIHFDAGLAKMELPLLYLIVFALIFIKGAGKYSIDYVIGKKKDRYSYYSY